MPITQAILPIAGLGTRFLPWTKVVPKELLPLGNRPIIALIVDECLEAGITDICFVISHGKEMIPQYFYDDPSFAAELRRRGKADLLKPLERYRDARFHVVYQEEQLGDGHAIVQAASWVKSDTVAILFGDDLFTGAASGIQQLIRAREKLPDEPCAILATEQVPRDATGRYGIVDPGDTVIGCPALRTVRGLVEKPAPKDAPSTLGIVGRYLIPHSLFDVLQKEKGGKDGEIRLIDALISQIHSLPIYACACEGTRIDTGSPEGYAKAVSLFGSAKE